MTSTTGLLLIRIAVVSHGGAINAYLAHLIGAESDVLGRRATHHLGAARP